MEKICWQITVAAFMQPLQYDLRSPAAKDNSITNAATARSNLDAAITMRSAETELQNTIELRATASEIVAPTPCVDRTCTKHRWNPIYNAEPIRPWSEHDPTMIRAWSDTHETVSHPSHRRGRSSRFGDGLCMEKHRVSCICYQNIGFRASAISQKRISCETSFKTPSATPPPAPLAMPFALRERSYSCKSQWNSIGNSSTSTTCNPIYIAGTILYSCKSQWNSVDRTCTKHRWNPIYNAEPIRAWSAHDPSMILPHTRPSRTRRTTEVDHRGSGTDFCMEKHRVSCICYLSKTHFVRDFLQNSIGNSSTSTTCNAICIAGTILQLQITMEFHRQLIHQHHLQSHLHCGNDPTVANHNGILSTAHARNTQVKPHLQCGTDPSMIRPWSEHDPIRHTRDRLAPVAPQR